MSEQWRKYIFIFFIMLQSNSLNAGFLDVLTNMIEDNVEYQVTVVDEDNTPVSGATVWVLTSSERRKNLQPEVVMERLVNKYAMDSDFVFNKNLHPALFVYYTNYKGEISLGYNEADLRGLDSFSISLAVLKRGFKPVLYSEESKLNSNNKFELKIERDKDNEFDARLLILDEVRATVSELNSLGVMSDERLLGLEQQEEKLRKLAEGFESEGEKDLASTVYFNLAYLPSVEKVKDEKGNIVVKGYTNGFDEKSAKKQQDKNKAIELNQSVPIIRYNKIYNHFDSNAGSQWRVDNNKSGLRKSFIKDTEAFYKNHPDRMWAWPYVFLWQVYRAEGQYDKAKDAIRAFRDFEPTYFNEKAWADLVYSASE